MLSLAKVQDTDVYHALRRSLQRKVGFGLFFVVCTPAQGLEIIAGLQGDLRGQGIEVLGLTKEVPLLFDEIERVQREKSPDILIVKGIEKSFDPYVKSINDQAVLVTEPLSEYGGRGGFYQLDLASLPPLLSHLNLQRDRFKRSFAFPLVFLLSPFAYRYLIRRAPDFFDWRSGIFEFPRDREAIEADSSRLLAEGYEDYLSLTSEVRKLRILAIKDLIKEPYQNEESKADLWFQLGLIYAANTDYQTSVDAFDHALQIKPDYYETWNNRGVALGNLGRYEEAIASYDHALQIKPNDHKAWYNRGNALDELGRYEEAITSYDHALQIKPDDESWNNRGVALRNLGRYEEAIASYDHALQIEPDDYAAWNNRGVTLSKLGRNEEAIASYQKSLAINPNEAGIYYNIARCLARQNNLSPALENLNQAITLDPKYRELAKTDRDFDRIRENPQFQTLLQP